MLHVQQCLRPDPTLAGNNAFTGNNTFPNINNIFVVDGVKYTTVAQALTACQGAPLSLPGCVIDMRGNFNAAALNLGTFDPMTTSVTLLLGPTTYTVNQIKLRSSLHIYGMGAGGLSQQTILQSCSTCSTTDMFVIGGTSPVSGIEIAHLRIYGANGNLGATNQSALSFIAQAGGGGVWFSTFHDLNISGFNGGGGTHGVIRLDGSAGGSPPGENQFDTFRNIQANRAVGGGPILEITGIEGQLSFIDNNFDAQPSDTTGTNILIQDSAANLFPFNIIFYNMTTQAGNVAVNTKGCNMCSFYQGHFEKSHGAFLVGPSASGTTNTTLQIQNSQFNNNVGIDSGNGYLVNVTESNLHAAVLFNGNNFGTPDATIKGNIAGATSYGNTGGTTVGSFLWNNNNGFPYTTINTGILPDGSGLKHKRVPGCTTGATSGNLCLTTVTWTTSFFDANYTVACQLVNTTALGHLGNTGVISAGSFQINTVTDSNHAISGTIDCIAVHD